MPVPADRCAPSKAPSSVSIIHYNVGEQRLSVNGRSPQSNKLVNTSPTSFGLGDKWPVATCACCRSRYVSKQTWANAKLIEVGKIKYIRFHYFISNRKELSIMGLNECALHIALENMI